MSYRITFALGGLEDADHARNVIGVLAHALVLTDELYLRAHPETTDLHSSGVRYHRTPQGAKGPGKAYWQDIPTCLHEGFADGVSLACWRVAELRVRSAVRAVPLVESASLAGGRTIFRVRVLLPDGTILDPSGNAPGEILDPRQRVAFVLGLFDRGKDRTLSDATLQICLDAITKVDEIYLRRNPQFPRLYDLDVTYQEEPPGQEDWQDIATIRRMRKADCDDLSPALTAERRVRDGIAKARSVYTKTTRKDGGTLYHIVTEHPDGRREDPSWILGMR